jgi:hypothetical protein
MTTQYLTSALDVGEWSASRQSPLRLPRHSNNPDTQWISSSAGDLNQSARFSASSGVNTSNRFERSQFLCLQGLISPGYIYSILRDQLTSLQSMYYIPWRPELRVVRSLIYSILTSFDLAPRCICLATEAMLLTFTCTRSASRNFESTKRLLALVLEADAILHWLHGLQIERFVYSATGKRFPEQYPVQIMLPCSSGGGDGESLSEKEFKVICWTGADVS